MNKLVIDSPLGPLTLLADDDALVGVFMSGHPTPEAELRSTKVLERTATQLGEYFAGTREEFDLPLAPQGTGFQQTVWRALGTIPFGTTRSYAEIAKRIRRPKAMRAVGAANGQNPISIIIPCHRVIGANGALVGYGGGLERKQWLLRHEGAQLL